MSPRVFPRPVNCHYTLHCRWRKYVKLKINSKRIKYGKQIEVVGWRWWWMSEEVLFYRQTTWNWFPLIALPFLGNTGDKPLSRKVEQRLWKTFILTFSSRKFDTQYVCVYEILMNHQHQSHHVSATPALKKATCKNILIFLVREGAQSQCDTSTWAT